MKTLWIRIAIIGSIISALAGAADAKSRIKDIVSFEGVRANELVGYGLVVGLNGTGDSLRNVPMTKQSLASMMERMGVNTRDANIDTKNIAAVMVTAKLPPFAATGSKIDVTVSSTQSVTRWAPKSSSSRTSASIATRYASLSLEFDDGS